MRRSGVLLHPTCLPGPFAIGDLGPAAVGLLDWLEAAGQTVWQVLPLGPTGMGNSPYAPLSAFAGDPLLISPQRLLEDGLLAESDLAEAEAGPPQRVDFELARRQKERLLRTAWRRFEEGRAGATVEALHAEFVAAPEQAAWLDDWALYAALKARFEGTDWMSWPEPERLRHPDAVARARRELEAELRFHRLAQFLFLRQWQALRRHGGRRGLSLLGDLPIYVAPDSADVWAHRELFDLEPDGRPRTVAGVPPDYFSATGQLWGNPIYRWERHAEDGFAWWIERVAANLRLADRLRIDHFRGFAGFWEVDAGQETAVDGRWRPGPGRRLFDALAAALGGLPLVAEDLGVITPDVEALRAELGLPGMKVLQFGFGEPDSIHAPHRVATDCVVYTGTHDNDTARGWFDSAPAEERRRLRDYLGTRDDEVHWGLVRAAWTSPAELALAPVQDLLGLGSEARMNTPGVGAGNWEWRLAPDALDDELRGRLRRLTEAAARSPADAAEAAARPPNGHTEDT